MFDFIQIVDDRMVLAIMKQSVVRDAWRLLLKPFRINSWVMIIVTLFILIVAVKGLSFLHKHSRKHAATLTKFHKLVVFMTWLFFIITEIYYEGGLTMFFATKISIPFHSIKDVMQSYPDYKLMMRKGFEAYYIDYVDDGDQDFATFWKRVQQNPNESVFLSIEQVLQDHEHNPVVIHDLQGAIDAYGKYGNPGMSEKLEVFYKGRSEYYSLIVTENSPLGPMLQHGTKVFFESGVIDHLSAKWLGRQNRIRSSSENEASAKKSLDINDMSLAFLTYATIILLCFVIFLGEVIFRKFWQFEFYHYLPSRKQSPDVERNGFKECKTTIRDKLSLEKNDNSKPPTKNEKNITNNRAQLNQFFDEFLKGYGHTIEVEK